MPSAPLDVMFHVATQEPTFPVVDRLQMPLTMVLRIHRCRSRTILTFVRHS